jgi:hypothetical protein
MTLVRDLPDTGHTSAGRVVLLCHACGGEYGATPGDYWQLAPDDELECCGEPCILATVRTTYAPFPNGNRRNRSR